MELELTGAGFCAGGTSRVFDHPAASRLQAEWDSVGLEGRRIHVTSLPRAPFFPYLLPSGLATRLFHNYLHFSLELRPDRRSAKEQKGAT